MREGFYSHLPMWPLIEKLNTYFNARFNERPHEEGYWECNGASKNCVDKTWPIPSIRHFGTFFLIYIVYHMTNDGHLPTSCFPCNLWILDKQAWNRLLEKYTVSGTNNKYIGLHLMSEVVWELVRMLRQKFDHDNENVFWYILKQVWYKDCLQFLQFLLIVVSNKRASLLISFEKKSILLKVLWF